jgi:hypothetical protein
MAHTWSSSAHVPSDVQAMHAVLHAAVHVGCLLMLQAVHAVVHVEQLSCSLHASMTCVPRSSSSSMCRGATCNSRRSCGRMHAYSRVVRGAWVPLRCAWAWTAAHQQAPSVPALSECCAVVQEHTLQPCVDSSCCASCALSKGNHMLRWQVS